MKGFITLTSNFKPTIFAVNSIGLIESSQDRNGKPYAVLTLALGHKAVYAVAETVEEVVALIIAAQ